MKNFDLAKATLDSIPARDKISTEVLTLSLPPMIVNTSRVLSVAKLLNRNVPTIQNFGKNFKCVRLHLQDEE